MGGPGLATTGKVFPLLDSRPLRPPLDDSAPPIRPPQCTPGFLRTMMKSILDTARVHEEGPGATSWSRRSLPNHARLEWSNRRIDGVVRDPDCLRLMPAWYVHAVYRLHLQNLPFLAPRRLNVIPHKMGQTDAAFVTNALTAYTSRIYSVGT
jgi:hypothetical protein